MRRTTGRANAPGGRRRYAGALACLGLLLGLGVPAQAEEVTGPPLYRIVVEWAGPDDVDLFASNPDRQVAWYHQRKQKDMELIRDGRGFDWAPLPNREETVIRGGSAGNYAASVYFFESQSKTPVSVSVRLEKIGPPAEILHEATIDLTRRGDERTVVGFHIDDAGTLTDLNTTEVSVVQQARVSLTGRTDGGVCPLNWNPDVPCWGEEARN